MRDGIHLAANLYLPEASGRYPALLQYTPYLKDGMGGRGARRCRPDRAGAPRVRVPQPRLPRLRRVGGRSGAAVRACREARRPRRAGVDRGASPGAPAGRASGASRTAATPRSRSPRRSPRRSARSWRSTRSTTSTPARPGPTAAAGRSSARSTGDSGSPASSFCRRSASARTGSALAGAARGDRPAVPVPLAHDPAGDVGRPGRPTSRRSRRQPSRSPPGTTPTRARRSPTTSGCSPQAPAPGTLEARAAGPRRPRADRVLRAMAEWFDALVAGAPRGRRRRRRGRAGRDVLREARPRLAHRRALAAGDRRDPELFAGADGTLSTASGPGGRGCLPGRSDRRSGRAAVGLDHTDAGHAAGHLARMTTGRGLDQRAAGRRLRITGHARGRRRPPLRPPRRPAPGLAERRRARRVLHAHLPGLGPAGPPAGGPLAAARVYEIRVPLNPTSYRLPPATG